MELRQGWPLCKLRNAKHSVEKTLTNQLYTQVGRAENMYYINTWRDMVGSNASKCKPPTAHV